jgi:hypothetical protein
LRNIHGTITSPASPEKKSEVHEKMEEVEDYLKRNTQSNRMPDTQLPSAAR